ncbi:MAG: YtxH domain-containing protein [Chlorobi bacterium]|nr:YtxH domain-containing protein [Chlorobiota bacterium]
MASMRDYHDESSSSYGKGMLIGLLTGGALGAALALLYAPKSGRELRADLAEKTNTYVDKTGDAINNASEKARQIVNDGRQRAEHIIEDAREKASSLLSDAERIVNDARAKAQETANKAQSDVKDQAGKVANATRSGMKAFKDELKSDPKPPIAGGT